MNRLKLIVLRAGDAVPVVASRRGEFAAMIRATVGAAWGGEWGEHDLRTPAPFPSLDEAAGFIVTGSGSSVSERAPWMLRAEENLRQAVAAEVPVLGVCFGHQLLAQALGGLVTPNPRGREIGTVRLEQHDDGRSDALFHGVPRAFPVNTSHLDSVARLPPGARLLAATERDPHAAFAVGEWARGVQFHPEFDGDVTRGYIEFAADRIRQEGADPRALLDTTADAPLGEDVLRNFARQFTRRSKARGGGDFDRRENDAGDARSSARPATTSAVASRGAPRSR